VESNVRVCAALKWLGKIKQLEVEEGHFPPIAGEASDRAPVIEQRKRCSCV